MISDKETKKNLFVRFFYCRPVANLKETSDLKGASRLLLHSRVTKVYKLVGDGRAWHGLLYDLMRRIVRYYVLFLAIANRFMNFLIVVIRGDWCYLLSRARPFFLEGSSFFSNGLARFFSWVYPIYVVGILDFLVFASLIQKKAVILWSNFTQGKNDEIFSLQIFAYHAVNERASCHLGAGFAHWTGTIG